MTDSPTLEVRALECVRGERQLFTGIDFTVPPGAALQVAGPNGAGKTSLLRIVCGLSLPESGTVLWDGAETRRARLAFCRELAYVGHAAGLKDELTPLENLAITRACAAAPGLDAATALDRVGMSHAMRQRCRDLSAGQRRRVALARLLAVEARLWVLDEPLTAVDADGFRMFEEILAAHLARGGVVLFTSHQSLRLDGASVERLELRRD